MTIQLSLSTKLRILQSLLLIQAMPILPTRKTPLLVVGAGVADGIAGGVVDVVVDEAEVVTIGIATISLRPRLLLKHRLLTSQMYSQTLATMIVTVVDVIDVMTVSRSDQIVPIRANDQSRSFERRMKRRSSLSPSFSITSWERWAS